MDSTDFKFGEWKAIPSRNLLENLADRSRHQLEPKTMDVLIELARQQNEVVSRQQFQESVWDGRIIVDESLTRCISELRRILGDNPRDPKYIETLSKRGYRLLSEVYWLKKKTRATLSVDDVSSTSNSTKPASILLLLAALILGIGGYWHINKQSLTRPEQLANFESLQELYDIFQHHKPTQLELVWHSNHLHTDRLKIISRKLDSGDDARLSLRIYDRSDLRLLNTVLPFATDAERYTAVNNLVTTLELLKNRSVDPAIIKLPEHLRSTYEQASYLVMEGDQDSLNEALLKFDEILKEQPSFIEAIVGKSMALRGLGMYSQSAERSKYQDLDKLLMQRLYLVQEDHPYLLAKTYRPPVKNIDWSEYEALLLGLVEAAPNCFECVKRLADFYLIVGWRSRAIALHEKHLSFYPTSSMAHGELAMLYTRAGNTEAVKRHTEVVQLMGKERWILPVEINYYAMLGNTEKWLFLLDKYYDRSGISDAIREIPAAIVADDDAKLQSAFERSEPKDFNMALSAGRIDAVLNRIKQNMTAGEYRDLSLIHGWRHTRNKINSRYLDGLKQLQNHPDTLQIFADVGLLAFWKLRNQLPDDCELDSPPSFCKPFTAAMWLET